MLTGMVTTVAARIIGTANVKLFDIIHPLFFSTALASAALHLEAEPHIIESRISLSNRASMGHHCDYAQPYAMRAYDYLCAQPIMVNAARYYLHAYVRLC